MNTGIVCMLRDSGHFTSLPKAEIEKLSAQISLKKYNKGEYIYREGTDINYVYIVIKGSVKLESITMAGKQIIKELAYANDMFGENIFSNQNQRNESADAIMDTNVLLIPTRLFRNLALKYPAFANELTLRMMKKIKELEGRISSFSHAKAKDRIINFFQHLAKAKSKVDQKLGRVLHHGLSHLEIAQITDTSRQTVARVMAELKKEGMISFPNRKPHTIVVHRLID